MSPINELLQKTSRTFALSIPLLPDELQHSVSVAYLLFRIVDTIEDDLPDALEDRARALVSIADEFVNQPDVMCEMLRTLRFDTAALSNNGYVDLLERAGIVIDAFCSLQSRDRVLIASHLSRTCRGMAEYLGRDLSSGTLDDVQEYCYIVAGIVGELLTELFIVHDPDLAEARDELIDDAAAFGEGLQLVNIIRDATDDLHAGRCYLPSSVDRPRLIQLARENLTRASNYVGLLDERSSLPGIVRFNALNHMLAVATIGAVEQHGPGVKLSRDAVASVYARVMDGCYSLDRSELHSLLSA